MTRTTFLSLSSSGTREITPSSLEKTMRIGEEPGEVVKVGEEGIRRRWCWRM